MKLLPTAKFSLKTCKGSYSERIKLAKSLNKNFFNKIDKKYTTKEVPFDVFEKTLKECTPEEINVNVLPYPYKGGYTAFELNNTYDGIDKLSIYIEKNFYDKGIRLLNTDTSLHETFHYFCALANPKHTARAAKMYEKNLISKTQSFYNENLYTKKDFKPEELREKLNDFLKQFTPEEQVDFLQNSRYRMLEEYNAFDEGYKYLDKIQDKHPDLIIEKIYTTPKEEYNFPDKIKIVTDKLKEVIAECRKY